MAHVCMCACLVFSGVWFGLGLLGLWMGVSACIAFVHIDEKRGFGRFGEMILICICPAMEGGMKTFALFCIVVWAGGWGVGGISCVA